MANLLTGQLVNFKAGSMPETKYLVIYRYQSLSYIFKILILCLSCSIMAPKTSTHSMMKWDDEQITSFLKKFIELYVTYINRYNFKNASLIGLCQYSQPKQIDKLWTINNIQSKIHWHKKHHKVEWARALIFISSLQKGSIDHNHWSKEVKYAWLYKV